MMQVMKRALKMLPPGECWQRLTRVRARHVAAASIINSQDR
jgi:hypothetical protein